MFDLGKHKPDKVLRQVYSNLDKMLAHTGGQFLATADMHPAMLVAAFILLTAFFNLFVGSMSAKWAKPGALILHLQKDVMRKEMHKI